MEVKPSVQDNICSQKEIKLNVKGHEREQKSDCTEYSCAAILNGRLTHLCLPHSMPQFTVCPFVFFVLHTTLFPRFIFLLSLHSGFSIDTGPLPLEEESGKQHKEIMSKAGERQSK